MIGCDGLHSGVRRLAFGDEDRFKRYLCCYVAAFTTGDYPIEYGSDVIYLAPNLVLSLFGLKDRQAIAVFHHAPRTGARLRAERCGQKMALRAALPSRDWKIPELLDRMESATDFFLDSVSQIRMESATDFFLDSVSQIRMDRWSKGRIALIGDAAYCPTLLSGFGAQLGLAEANDGKGNEHRVNGITANSCRTPRMRMAWIHRMDILHRLGGLLSGSSPSNSRAWRPRCGRGPSARRNHGATSCGTTARSRSPPASSRQNRP